MVTTADKDLLLVIKMIFIHESSKKRSSITQRSQRINSEYKGRVPFLLVKTGALAQDLWVCLSRNPY